MVTGMQNNSARASAGPDGKHLRVGACCKHFGVYDVEGGAGTPSRMEVRCMPRLEHVSCAAARPGSCPHSPPFHTTLPAVAV